MHFSRFGITLRRLRAEDIDAVRQWRNSDWVRPYMRHRAVVAAADQQRWFERLDARCDWYFRAETAGLPFALFHVKNVDWAERCGEAGGFVGDPGYIGRPEPGQATLALMDFAFLVLRLDALEAQYLASLRKVVRFNEQLGYEVICEDADGFRRARVTRERYLSCAAPFRRAAESLHGTEATLANVDPWLAAHMRV